MIIRSALFSGSFPSITGCPKAKLPEYAFIGRSNVGKSSLINMITGMKGLAKTSGTPGKTRLLNYFLINESWHLVDLPGYGFAKVSQTVRAGWESMIREYLFRRKQLATVFVLVDSRIEPMSSDLKFIDWLGEKQIPLVLVFTKTDKLTKKKLKDQSALFQEKLLQTWAELPPFILSSAENKTGREEILRHISLTNEEFHATRP